MAVVEAYLDRYVADVVGRYRYPRGDVVEPREDESPQRAQRQEDVGWGGRDALALAPDLLGQVGVVWGRWERVGEGVPTTAGVEDAVMVL